MAASGFGLDIGRSYIKVVEVEVSGSKKVLTAAASAPTPAGGIQSESPVELKKVSSTIRELVESAGIDNRRCTISLVESQVVTRLIQMPSLTDKELGSAINWEAEKYVPLPLKDVNLQYKKVSRQSEETSQAMDVLLVAAPKRLVEKYVGIVKNAGLAINALETESLALTRALSALDDPSTLIVSMGAVSTEMVISYRGNVIFTRSIATGGLSMTRAIMAEFNLPQNQAEQYKQAYGVLEDKLSGKLAAVLRPILDVLVGEVLKAADFFKTHFNDNDIGVVRIVVCGGGAYLPGISQFLTERTSLEVSLGDPWLNFSKEGLVLRLLGQGSFYSVATGLAMRG